MQYIIYLTNGVEEEWMSISGNKESALEKMNVFKEQAKRDDAWYELREYKRWSDAEYSVVCQ